MNDFFRFPHTPHLAWLGDGSPRDDKVLSPSEVRSILQSEVIVEEKLDGANLGFSVGADGRLRVQNRGQYLEAPYTGQFSRLTAWISEHEKPLTEALGETLILFGEWCAARHSLNYDHLPDWFLAFDVYDKSAMKFWSTARRNVFTQGTSLVRVPFLLRGETSLDSLKVILTRQRSNFGDVPLEGVVVRTESDEWLESRSKIVRADFTQGITDHWSRKGIEWNRLRLGNDFSV